MEFLWCIPVCPVATSLSYYFYQEGQATREHNRLVTNLTGVFMDLTTLLLNRIASRTSYTEDSVSESDTESSHSSEAEPVLETEPVSEPASHTSNDHVVITIPDPEWDENHNNVSWELGSEDWPQPPLAPWQQWMRASFSLSRSDSIDTTWNQKTKSD